MEPDLSLPRKRRRTWGLENAWGWKGTSRNIATAAILREHLAGRWLSICSGLKATLYVNAFPKCISICWEL